MVRRKIKFLFKLVSNFLFKYFKDEPADKEHQIAISEPKIPIAANINNRQESYEPPSSSPNKMARIININEFQEESLEYQNDDLKLAITFQAIRQPQALY